MSKLNRLVAERVMGWHDIEGGWGKWYNKQGEHVRLEEDWHPDTNIADAWELVRHLRTQGYLLRLIDQHHCTGVWDCRFYKFPESVEIEYQNSPNECIAICLAALRAKGLTDAEIGEALK